MKSGEYPFVSCFSPRLTVNPYTREKLLVGCRKCPACRCRKSSSANMKCELERNSHKLSMFITLTYDPESLPRFDIKRSGNGVFSFNIYDVTPRFGNSVDDPLLVVEDVELPILNLGSYLDDLYKKTDLAVGQGLGYVSIFDVQKYIKRLRKYVYSKTQSKFRIYYVSEYGPRTFRPHYHLILFYDDPSITELFPYDVSRGKCISPCWPFGFSEAEVVQSTATSYITSYVVGSCDLPQIYQTSFTRPFSHHSKFLGQEALESSTEKVITSPSVTALSRSCRVGSKYVDVSPWRSYFTRFFPKCKGYSGKSHEQRIETYRSLQRSYEFFKRFYRESLMHYTKRVLDKFFFGLTTGIVSPDLRVPFGIRFVSWTDEIQEYVNIDPCYLGTGMFPDDDLYQKYFSRLYSVFLTSQQFTKLAYTYDSSPVDGITLINRQASRSDYQICKRFYFDCVKPFYESLEYNRLRDFYLKAEKYYKEDDLPLWYDSGVSLVRYDYSDNRKLLRKNSMYESMVHDFVVQSENSVKHKILNDMNKIFIKSHNL